MTRVNKKGSPCLGGGASHMREPDTEETPNADAVDEACVERQRSDKNDDDGKMRPRQLVDFLCLRLRGRHRHMHHGHVMRMHVGLVVRVLVRRVLLQMAAMAIVIFVILALPMCVVTLMAVCMVGDLDTVLPMELLQFRVALRVQELDPVVVFGARHGQTGG